MRELNNDRYFTAREGEIKEIRIKEGIGTNVLITFKLSANRGLSLQSNSLFIFR